VASLRELETVAREITGKRLDDLDALRRWLAVLVAPGASLGGARPKSNFTDTDESLWIAKFPAKDDERDIGAWEFLAHSLAQRIGIDVPAARTCVFGGDFHTFCIQRFDRISGRRRFYASAMAMLRKDQSEGTSYLEMAEFLHHRGARQYVQADHVLNLDESDNRPSLATVIDTSEWYSISKDRGAKIAQQITRETRHWRRLALHARIARADIELTAPAFEHSGPWP